ncbi:PIR Superfamily Protein [Plasmodium ovale curtisi]|uniref:PIR Superfamily Protein n=1 Tax=Plasmodium ovale curtisi TaxID=864141 RepID=A0A1A8WR06_PLAOA|nr:PIR Superfamily Protein [Plasmodium ovale curtisi]
MIKICENFLRYLENCEALNNSSFSYHVSILLNYWLYDKLTNIYKDNNTNEISIGFGSLLLIWDKINYPKKNEPYYKKCKPNLNMVNHPDWNKRKDINPMLVLTCLQYDHQVEKEKAAAQARHMPQDSRQEPQSGTHGHGPGAPVTPVGSDAALTQEKFGIGAKYTPIGSWIRKISGCNPNSISNMDGGEID